MKKELTVKEALAEIDKRITLLEKLEAIFKRQIAAAEKAPELTLEGLVAAYQRILRLCKWESDATCLNLLRKAESTPSKASLKAAQTKLIDLANDTLRAHAKDDKAKQAKLLHGHLNDLADDLGEVVTAGDRRR